MSEDEGFCRKCGAETKEGNVFCSKCGTALSQNESIPTNVKTDKSLFSKKIVLIVLGIFALLFLVGVLDAVLNPSQTSTVESINSVSTTPSTTSEQDAEQKQYQSDVAYLTSKNVETKEMYDTNKNNPDAFHWSSVDNNDYSSWCCFNFGTNFKIIRLLEDILI